ncbi:glycoside hydrolase family 3 protein [Nonlabens spongiae]|nr:glycoside hydrolase family 3 N-terminal domain-containing protein [Nonlabens spongiae]
MTLLPQIKIRGFWQVGIFTFLLASCEDKKETQVDMKPTDAEIIENRVDSLLAIMTLDEKIGQMTQVRHFWDLESDSLVTSKFIGSIIHTQGGDPGKTVKDWQNRFIELQKRALQTRLGIPLLLGVDAVHGQNTFDGATIFPHNIGMGATRNPDLVKKAAEVTAIESQATGFNWVFSPCVAIPFNEKWGRTYEAFSESTELTSELTKASIQGHQGESLKDRHTVMATAKHFMGDGATVNGAEGGETILTDQEISNLLMPPYQAAVDEGVGAVMASFNTLNGKSMHTNKAMITDTLKGKMGFDGIVLTDWKGYSRFGGNDVVNAGVDMFMAVDGDMPKFHEGIKRGIRKDSVSMDRINDAVRRILRQKFRLGLFENPFPDTSLVKKVGSKSHRNIARQAVRESLVLLKNKGVLPLNKDLEKIVVVGEHADNSGLQSGGWSVNWQGTLESYNGSTTILDGIKRIATGQVVYDQIGTQTHPDAEVAIIAVGETPYAEFMGDVGNGRGVYRMTLSRKHKDYIAHYKKQGIPVVILLVSGRPMVVTPEINKSDAFIAAWLPGSEGDGVAEVLFGEYDFSGKLPHSWPKYVKDFDGEFGPNLWDESIEPLFQFGYGLNYKEKP